MMRVMDGRWKGTILWRLQDGPRRTSALKPINRLQTAAAKTGGRLDGARVLQTSWEMIKNDSAPRLLLSLLVRKDSRPSGANDV
jgi:hypothetical protein